MKIRFKLLFPLVVTILAYTSCATKEFQSISKVGSSVLGKTGVVSQSQADTMFEFGSALNSNVQAMTEEQEYYVGRGVSAHILGRYEPLKNEQLNQYINKIALVVASASERPETFGGYKVQVLDSPEINALSAPGGFIFVTKGFLKIVPNEDALAALMAHEVAHIVKGHGISAIKSANLTGALVKLGKASTPSEIAAISNQITSTFGNGVEDIVALLLTKGYSRSQEYESDEYAVGLLKRSGYRHSGLSTMLTSLKAASEAASKGGWTSTHPDAEDRIDELDEVKEVEDGSKQQKVRDQRFQSAMKNL